MSLRKKIHYKQEQCSAAFDAVEQHLNDNPLDDDSCKKIVTLSTNDLQQGLQDGSLTASEVLRAYQMKALSVNEKLNCVTEPLLDAWDRAKACDEATDKKGLLHGMPVSLKENFDLENMDTTIGLAQLVGEFKSEEAVLVQVVKYQGGIPFVRTNLPQTMLTYECSNPVFGRTDNPHDSSRGPGGSSGGESALLAAGGSILGMGNDLGGSIRVPCHFAGCCGLKPTAERLSRKGMFNIGKGQQLVKVAVGPLSRDVDGLVIFMRALLCDYHFHLDPTVPPIPFRDEIYESKRHLKIGYYSNDGYIPAVPACDRAVKLAKHALEKLGHTLVEFKPPRAADVFVEFMRDIGGDGWQDVVKAVKQDIIDPNIADMIFLITWPKCVNSLFSRFIQYMSKDPVQAEGFLARKGIGSVHEWFQQTINRQAYEDEFYAAWQNQGLDAVICPTFATPAVPHGDIINVLGGALYSILYNVLNYPAGVVPVTSVIQEDVANMEDYPRRTATEKKNHGVMVGSVGLPVGVQCAAPMFHDEVVLRVMKDIETSLKLTY